MFRLHLHSILASLIIDAVVGQLLALLIHSQYDPSPIILGLIFTGGYWLTTFGIWAYEGVKSMVTNLLLFRRVVAVAFESDLKGYDDLRPYSFSLQEPSEYFSILADEILDKHFEGLRREPSFQKARKAYISAGALSAQNGFRKYGTAKGLEAATDRLTRRGF